MVRKNNFMIVGCLLVAGNAIANSHSDLSEPFFQVCKQTYGERIAREALAKEKISREQERARYNNIVVGWWQKQDLEKVQDLQRRVKLLVGQNQRHFSLLERLQNMDITLQRMEEEYKEKIEAPNNSKTLADLNAQVIDAEALFRAAQGFENEAKSLLVDRIKKTQVEGFVVSIKTYSDNQAKALASLFKR